MLLCLKKSPCFWMMDQVWNLRRVLTFYDLHERSFREQERHKKILGTKQNFDLKEMIFSHTCTPSSHEFLVKTYYIARKQGTFNWRCGYYSDVTQKYLSGWMKSILMSLLLWLKIGRFCLKVKINKCIAIR